MFIQIVGTGKTYLGLRVIETLLANAKQTPILIACYTNHALDQFLEGIMKYCATDGELVRIGRTKCEALKKCQLSNIKLANKQIRSRRQRLIITQQRKEIDNQIQLISQTISNLEMEVDRICNAIVGNEIIEIMCSLNPNHHNQLQGVPKQSDLTTNILN